MEHKRELDLKRAQKIIAKKKKKQIETDSSSTSIKYIKVTHTTEEGKKAENTAYEINKETIEEQSKYDGFYAVSTSLSHQEMPVKKLLKLIKVDGK